MSCSGGERIVLNGEMFMGAINTIRKTNIEYSIDLTYMSKKLESSYQSYVCCCTNWDRLALQTDCYVEQVELYLRNNTLFQMDNKLISVEHIQDGVENKNNTIIRIENKKNDDLQSSSLTVKYLVTYNALNNIKLQLKRMH